MSLPIINLNDRQAIINNDYGQWGTKINNIQQELANGINELYDDILEINGVSSGLATKLDKDGYGGTAQDLKDEIDLKAPIDSPTFTGTVSGVSKSMVGLGSVDNTSDLTKMSVSTFVDLQTSDKTITGAINEVNTTLSKIDGVYVFDTIAEMQEANYLKEGDIVQLLGYYSKNDGAEHKRVFSLTDNGSGEIVTSGGYLNYIVKNGIINVTHFGAKGDGLFDNSSAIKKSQAFAVSLQNSVYNSPTIKFPAGDYAIYESGVFSYAGESSTAKGSLNYVGDGWFSSRIILITEDTEKYFYDNGSSYDRYFFNTYSDLWFSSDNYEYGNFFKLYSDGYEQGFKFNRCVIRKLNKVLICNGTSNNSEHKFFMCRINSIKTNVLEINNLQSLNTEFFGCDVESIEGDVIKVLSSGGGSVKVFGGSWILSNGTADRYLLNLADTSSLGGGNLNFSFNGIRTEFIDVYAKLLKHEGTAGSSKVTFTDCNLEHVLGGERNVVTIGHNRRLYFNSCQIPTEFLFTITALNASAVVTGVAGLIKFSDSMIPTNLKEKITITNLYGRAIAKNCTPSTTLLIENQAINFNKNWENESWGECEIEVHRAIGLPRGGILPYDGSHETTIKLPINSTIKNIYFYKPTTSGIATNVSYSITNNDKTITHASSDSNPQTSIHKIFKENYFYNVGTTDNNRILRLSINTTSASRLEKITGFFYFIEYL